MVAELLTYSTIATVTTIAPVYKIRGILVKLLSIPVIGMILVLGYGFGSAWVLLKLFSMQSSVAGLANMLSSILFTVWLFVLKKTK